MDSGGAAPLLDARLGYALLAFFSVIWVVLGILWGRKASSYEGYAVAGRNVGLAMGATTTVASWITSNTTMLAPQFALQLGVWGMLAYSTASFGLFAFAPLAKRIRAVMPDGYTAVEFIHRRYGRPASVPFLLISLFYALTWLVTMAMAGGKLLEVLSGIPYEIGLTVVMTACILYTLFGGMYAVIGTDFIQSVIIIVGLIVVSVAVLGSVSVEEVHSNLAQQRPMLLSLMFPAALMAIFNNMLFGFGEIFHSNVWWSRTWAMRQSVGPRAFVLSGLIWLPIPIVAGYLGLCAPALGVGISQPDAVGPLVAAHVLGDVGAIMVFIIVFCSLASSIDSLLAATGDLLAHDVVLPAMRRVGVEPVDITKRRCAGASVLGLGLFAWLLALANRSDLASVLFFSGPLVGSCIWPILGGLYFRRPGPWAAAAAMVLGSGAGLYSYFAIDWFVASLVGTTVSGIVYLVGTAGSPADFNFDRLRGDAAQPVTFAPALVEQQA